MVQEVETIVAGPGVIGLCIALRLRSEGREALLIDRDEPGFRPSLPDSLPVIGRSPRARNLIYAFGHGHLGLTLAAETARIVSDLIINNQDGSELAALSPARFR